MARVCEIIESAEESKVGMISFPSSEHKYSIEDDINRLFESFNLRNPSRSSGISSAALKKNPSKKPMRSCSSPSTGIGISEQASLKQALRGLCISQASEMAAMKRFSKSMNSSKQSEAVNIKTLYRTLQTNRSGISGSSIKGKSESTTTIVEVSLVPEITDSNSPIQNGNFNEELKQEASVGPVDEAILVEEVVAVEGSVSSVVSNDEIKGEANSSSAFSEPRVKKSSIFGNKNFTKKKMKHDSQKGDIVPVSRSDCHETSLVFNVERREKGNSPSRNTQGVFKKAEFSQSSKSSIGESSSSTSISDASNLSSSSRGGSRPHMSRDLRWEAIKSVEKQHGAINLKHFKLLKSLGCGDIGTVYLAELVGSGCHFALKVMENEFLKTRKKMLRAKTEKEIMQMLDHPFLPTLYCHFTTDKLSCLVMECCPGGDLHVLRQKQPARCFYEQAARFYVAEVLLALEYLHMLGVVYRDLKPENILVREDGHIMLSDFDLSLRCSPNTVLVSSSPPCKTDPPRNTSSPCTESSSCVDPFCLHPSWQVPCFTPGLSIKNRKLKHDYLGPQVSPLPQLVVEPTSARSNSFVGTHEYLAPEIVRGDGHGAAVDWWTFGVFLFELLYGKTPFKGSSNEETLSNVVSRSLKFPSSPVVSFHARDLIRGLLVKDPENRLGSSKGATEIKQHGFFEGLNWALIRCAVPPELPKSFDFRAVSRINEAVGFEVF